MLTGITLENFKAFKDPQFIPIKPITLVFGPNSAGKSSIVHALAFLQHAFENQGACDPSKQEVGWETFDLGGFSNLLFGHANQGKSMSVSLHFTNCSAKWSFRLFEYGPRLTFFSARVVDPKRPQDEIFVEWGGYRLTLSENHPLICTVSDQIWKFVCTGRSWESPEAAKVSPVISEEVLHAKVSHYLTKKSAKLLVNSFIPTYLAPKNANSDDYEGELEFSSPTFQGSEIRQLRYNTHKKLLSDPGNTDPVDELLDKLNWESLLTDATLAELAAECKQLFSNRVHLGSTRHPPERKIDVSLPFHEPWRMVLDYQHLRNSINITLEELDMPYKLDVSHVEEIHYKPGIDPVWARELDPHKSYVERIHRTRELSFVTKGGVSLSHKDLGYGVSTTVPILVVIHVCNGCFVSIEQPELHIHPRIQTVLGDLFIQTSLAGMGCDVYDDYDLEFDIATDMAREFGDFDVGHKAQVYYDPTKNNHLLIETHSEHLILRILRRIRETTERDFESWTTSLKEACPNGVRPEDVAVIYVQPGENGALVKNLRINELGEFIDEWPNGFFDERIREIF